MLKAHEARYIDQNTKNPRIFKVGKQRYEAWSDMWPNKNQVNLTTLRWPETKVDRFLASPEEKWGDNRKVSYEWYFPILKKHVLESRN